MSITSDWHLMSTSRIFNLASTNISITPAWLVGTGGDAVTTTGLNEFFGRLASCDQALRLVRATSFLLQYSLMVRPLSLQFSTCIMRIAGLDVRRFIVDDLVSMVSVCTNIYPCWLRCSREYRGRD